MDGGGSVTVAGVIGVGLIAGCGGGISEAGGEKIADVDVLSGVAVAAVAGCGVLGGVMNTHTPTPISTPPIMLDKILGRVDSLGTSNSFTLTPPPNIPMRRAKQPAIIRTTGGVMIFSSKKAKPGRMVSLDFSHILAPIWVGL
jgi:hypothetical protein